MNLLFHNLSQKYLSDAKLNNVNNNKKRLMGFEPPSRTIHSITGQHQCDHDYGPPAFSQVSLLLGKMRINKHSRRFDFSTADLRK